MKPLLRCNIKTFVRSKEKVLAVCTTALGDLTLCTPAIAALSQVFLVDGLCHEKRAPLLQNSPRINRLYTYRNNDFKRAWLALKLRSNYYKRVAILHANDDIKRLLPWLRYEKAYNIQGWDEPRLRLQSLYRDRGTMHAIDLPLMVGTACGAAMPPLAQRKPEVFLSADELEYGRAWLASQGADERPLVGLVPGGAYPRLKRWPAANFGKLAKDLHAMGLQVVVLAAPNEKGLLEAMRLAGANNFIAAFNLPLRSLCAIIARFKIMITNDTGPLHLAHALGTPTLSLFGLTNPDVLAPRAAIHSVISSYRQLNEHNHEQVMSLISYQEVWQAAQAALS